jgi:antitoxin (DNA-binding transcriptional repressor) of toxin-antitoxin stability system
VNLHYIATSHGRAVAKIVPIRKEGGVTRGSRAAFTGGILELF